MLLFRSGLRKKGWFESYRSGPVDKGGDPIPLMPYSFIDFASSRLKSSLKVFEFGSGNSTVWWASHIKSVTSVEHNREWYEYNIGSLPENAELLYREKDEYSSAITSYSKFDIICIDGIQRVNCVKNALEHMTEKGVIVWDDSDRDEYQDGYDLLFDEGFREIYFQDMGPVSPSLQRTSIFYRDENCLEL